MGLNPFARPFAMALTYIDVRQYDAAIKDARMRPKTNPQEVSLHWVLTETYRRKGALKEAAEEWEKSMLLGGDTGNGISAATIKHAYEKGGYRAVLLQQLSYLKQKSATQYVSRIDMALQYAQLGDKEKTLSLLGAGIGSGLRCWSGFRETLPMISFTARSVTGRSFKGLDCLRSIEPEIQSFDEASRWHSTVPFA